MITINMLSKADSIQGQGVLSAYIEQVNLVKDGLYQDFIIYENKNKFCDIMHYHTINPNFFAMLPFAKLKGTTVGYVHFLPETLEKSISLPPIIKNIFYKYVISFYKSMDYLVTVNPYFIDRLECYGINRDKVSYIPNFVSEEKFYKLEDSQKQILRDKYNIPRDKFTVICAGQLQKRKGIFDFIEIATRMPDVQFIWAGTFSFGKISDGYKQIKQIVENPPENIKFLGLIPRDKMNELYNIADVMFLPSFEELFPMTILESMNSSVPILLRDLDIYEKILFDFYLKADDNNKFEAIIRKLQNDTGFYKKASKMSFKGHCFYSKENVLNMWKDFYTNIALNGKPYNNQKVLIPFANIYRKQ